MLLLYISNLVLQQLIRTKGSGEVLRNTNTALFLSWKERAKNSSLPRPGQFPICSWRLDTSFCRCEGRTCPGAAFRHEHTTKTRRMQQLITISITICFKPYRKRDLRPITTGGKGVAQRKPRSNKDLLCIDYTVEVETKKKILEARLIALLTVLQLCHQYTVIYYNAKHRGRASSVTWMKTDLLLCWCSN